MSTVKRVFRGSGQSYFLFGPRGTGKTTWLKSHYPQAIFINLLDPATFQTYVRHPEHILSVVRGYAPKTVFILDEIQRVPSILPCIHILIEEKQNWQFILTGSSARKLKQTGVDLLGGRAALYHLHPFMACELKDQFDLEKALTHGMVPLIHQSQNSDESKLAYIGLYLREEVLQEGIVRKIEPFSQFLETISFSQASSLTLTNIAREVGINRRTVDNYCQILQDLLLSFMIPVFTKRAQRALVASPKFYFFDAGIYQALRPKGPFDQPSEIAGHALETLVAQHLRAWIDYSQEAHKLFYWRTHSGVEVDFVIYGESVFCAIEVKHTNTIRSADLKGLKLFRQDYPEASLLLLYRGETRQNHDGITCVPVQEFLKHLRPSAWMKDLLSIGKDNKEDSF